jgi:hypothetical protein
MGRIKPAAGDASQTTFFTMTVNGNKKAYFQRGLITGFQRGVRIRAREEQNSAKIVELK